MRVLLSIFFSFCAFAAIADSAFDKAGAFYKSGQYKEAAEQYEKMIAQSGADAAVYYNLGNCYFKLNLLGKSILSYERAQRLAPDDEDIVHNLKLAQLKAVDRVQSVPQLGLVSTWKKFVASQSSSGWGTYALAAVWSAILLAGIYLFLMSNKLLKTLAYTLTVASFLLLSLAFIRHNGEVSSGEGILLAESLNIKSAPDENAGNIFILHEGVKFKLLDRVGSWHKIRLADGKVGWLQQDAFERI